MIFKSRIILMVFRQFIYEGFIPSIRTWDTLTTNNKNMLNVRHIDYNPLTSQKTPHRGSFSKKITVIQHHRKHTI